MRTSGRTGYAWVAGVLLCGLLGGCTAPGEPPVGGQDVDDEPIAYGTHPDQVADLRVPTGTPPTAGWPVVVLLHGGFWREPYRRDLMVPLAGDLHDRGYAAWNVEYRRVGGAGGWPSTLEDVAAAVDHLADLDQPLDLDRVAVAGHSAGGHLALWVAGRGQLTDDAPGSRPRVQPCAAVGLAAVADLAAADATGLGDGAARDLLGGGPDEVPERWAVADPARLVGHGVPVLLSHGDGDDSVPVEQSLRYADAARLAGDAVEVATDRGDHFTVIDPASSLWGRVVDFLETTC